jgi:hypothetical protein
MHSQDIRVFNRAPRSKAGGSSSAPGSVKKGGGAKARKIRPRSPEQAYAESSPSKKSRAERRRERDGMEEEEEEGGGDKSN